MNSRRYIDCVRKDLFYIRRDIAVINTELIELKKASDAWSQAYRSGGGSSIRLMNIPTVPLYYIRRKMRKLECELARQKYLEVFSENRLSLLLD